MGVRYIFGDGGQVLITTFRPDSIPFASKCLWAAILTAPLMCGIASGQMAMAQSLAGAPPGRFTTVIDAGHGGDDGGARLGNLAEKAVTLTLSVRLRSLLAARGFQVVTTRESDVNLDSDARAQVANRAVAGAAAAACLSFHVTESGAGVHLYISSLAPVTAGAGTRFLAWKTAQAAFVGRSLKLQGTLNGALTHETGGPEAIPITLARASLPGLDSMACPAVAVEIAPLRGTDRSIVTDVTDSGYQSRIVEALATALLEWRADQLTGGQASGQADGQPDKQTEREPSAAVAGVRPQ